MAAEESTVARRGAGEGDSVHVDSHHRNALELGAVLACHSRAYAAERSEAEKRTNPTHERWRVGFIGAPISYVEVMDRLSG